MPQLACRFAHGDKVLIDGCASIKATVTMIEWRRPDVVRYECSWIDGGKAEFVIFDEWRLTPAPA